MARITETQLTVPVLLLLSTTKGGWMPTSELIQTMDQEFAPRGKDNQIIKTRNDSFFSQKVRNMVCHRHNKSSYIARGFADYQHDVAGVGGLRITAKGRRLLRQNEAKIEAALDARPRA